MFQVAEPGKDGDFVKDINPGSLQVLKTCVVESSLVEAKCDQKYQFEREGYFCLDTKDSSENQLVFNRIVALRDTWAG